jgi:hypothetical protein
VHLVLESGAVAVGGLGCIASLTHQAGNELANLSGRDVFEAGRDEVLPARAVVGKGQGGAERAEYLAEVPAVDTVAPGRLGRLDVVDVGSDDIDNGRLCRKGAVVPPGAGGFELAGPSPCRPGTSRSPGFFGRLSRRWSTECRRSCRVF